MQTTCDYDIIDLDVGYAAISIGCRNRMAIVEVVDQPDIKGVFYKRNPSRT